MLGYKVKDKMPKEMLEMRVHENLRQGKFSIEVHDSKVVQA